MLLLSLNLRGMGGTLKLASMRSTLEKTRPNIVFLQKTLVHSEKACSFFHSIRPSWLTCAVNSVGNSGGLFVSWDPNYFNLIPFFICGGIFLTRYCLEIRRQLNLLNVYGSCLDRKKFWENMESLGLLKLKGFILAGHLNLTLSSGEIWVASALLGPLANFFNSYFHKTS